MLLVISIVRRRGRRRILTLCLTVLYCGQALTAGQVLFVGAVIRGLGVVGTINAMPLVVWGIIARVIAAGSIVIGSIFAGSVARSFPLVIATMVIGWRIVAITGTIARTITRAIAGMIIRPIDGTAGTTVGAIVSGGRLLCTFRILLIVPFVRVVIIVLVIHRAPLQRLGLACFHLM